MVLAASAAMTMSAPCFQVRICSPRRGPGDAARATISSPSGTKGTPHGPVARGGSPPREDEQEQGHCRQGATSRSRSRTSAARAAGRRSPGEPTAGNRAGSPARIRQRLGFLRRKDHQMITGRMTLSAASASRQAGSARRRVVAGPDPQRTPDQVRGLGHPWPILSVGRRGHQHGEHLFLMDAAVPGRVEDQQPPVAALQPPASAVRGRRARDRRGPGKVGQDAAQVTEGLGVQRRGEPRVQLLRL